MLSLISTIVRNFRWHIVSLRRRVADLLSASLLLLFLVKSAQAQLADFAAIIPIDLARANNEIDHVSFRKNSLTTVYDSVGGGIVIPLTQPIQFAAYYDENRRIQIARRALGSSTWTITDTTITDPNSNLSDTHNVISICVDGDGYLHLSYGMHNNNLLYRKSSAAATNLSTPITFSTVQAMTGRNENSVTYPQFYNLPDGDVMFFYRNGGSGDGNSYFNRYDTDTDTWSVVAHPFFDGLSSSVNAYPNKMAIDSQGTFQLSWTDRSTPAFQTNHNIYFARSGTQGTTWTKMDGTPYSLPILESTAEKVVDIPENSTLINQTGMTVDKYDRPVVGSWWSPGAPHGDFTRQYMLAYYDGAHWRISQITNRAPEPLQTDATVRDLARPIVLVDDDNRVLVVTRYDESNDFIRVAYSQDRENWSFIDLNSTAMNNWEPTYDEELWKRENKLSMLYQQVPGTTDSTTISIFQWDAKAFFEPGARTAETPDP